MGCGFSRRVVPNPSTDSSSIIGPDGKIKNSFINEGAIAALADATGTAAVKIKDTSLSFVVPIRDKEELNKEGGGSIIRRHPPVRLRRLEEEQQINRPKLTLGALERRQAEAEERRRKILDSRVQSAQHFQRKVQPETGTPSPLASTDWEKGENLEDVDFDEEILKKTEPEVVDKISIKHKEESLS